MFANAGPTARQSSSGESISYNGLPPHQFTVAKSTFGVVEHELPLQVADKIRKNPISPDWNYDYST